MQSSKSALVPQLMSLLAAAVRDTLAAQLAALAEGVPLLLGRMLAASSNSSSSSSTPPGKGGSGADPGGAGGSTQDVSSDAATLQIACCGALEALLDGCAAAQVRCYVWFSALQLEGIVCNPCGTVLSVNPK